jgi:hypothetical protein
VGGVQDSDAVRGSAGKVAAGGHDSPDVLAAGIDDSAGTLSGADDSAGCSR